MLPSHKEGNHYMRDFMVRKWSSVAVRLAHKGTNHIWFIILRERDVKRF
jgi:hypothetical protein